MNVFETLREQVPIGRLVEPGKGGKAHCVSPGHPDNRPSMHIYEDHVHCFATRRWRNIRRCVSGGRAGALTRSCRIGFCLDAMKMARRRSYRSGTGGASRV